MTTEHIFTKCTHPLVYKFRKNMNADLYKFFHPGKNIKRPSLRYYLNEDAWHAFDSKGNMYPPTTAQKQKFCSMLVDHVMKFQSVVGSFFFATPPNKKQTLKKRKKTNENTGQRSLIDLGFTNGMNMKKRKINSKNDQKKMKKKQKKEK